MPHTILRNASGDADFFRTVRVSRATHFPASRAAAGLFVWLTPCAVAVRAAAVAPEQQLVLVPFQEVGRERGVAGQGVVAGVGGTVAEQIRIVAEQPVGDSAPRDRAGRIRGFVLIVGADVGPERIRVPDERRLRVRLQDRLERLRESGRPCALVREVIDLLEVDQDRHLQVRGERVHAAQLGAVGGDVELELAEAARAVFHRLGQLRLGLRLGDVDRVEPDESARGQRPRAP